MKLLAKTAEDRYQTAAGLEADLRRCLAEWQAHGRIEPFPLGAQDVLGPAADPGEAVRAGARDRHAAGGLRPGRGQRHAGTRARLRLFRDRQVLGGERAAQGAGPAARPVRVRQVRPVQARHPVRNPGPGLPEPGPPAARPERGGAWPLAGRPARGARSERPAYRQPRPGAGARDRQTAAGRRTCRRGTRRTASRWCSGASSACSPAGAPARAVSGRSAMAGYRDARPARAPGDALRGAAPAAGRGLPRQRGRPRAPADAHARGDPRRRMRGSTKSCWRPSGSTMSASSSPMPCIASRSARGPWRGWCRRRPAAIRSSRSSSSPRWPKKGCSHSTRSRRPGNGTSIASAPRATPITSWTSWPGS